MRSNKDLFAVNANDSNNGIENVNDQNIVEESSLEFEKILNLCIDEICLKENSSCIDCHSENCLNQRIIEKIIEYIKKYERIPYSTISSKVYSLSDEEYENLSARAVSLVGFIKERRKSYDNISDSDLFKLMSKFKDHIYLANIQLSLIKEKTDKLINETEQKFEEKTLDIANQVYTAAINFNELSERTDNIKKEVQETKKELYTQLITIVSVFVSISFVMFGGMSLLNNLFDYSEMTSIPLLEMICGGSLIGIIMVCSVYMFVLFILRVTGKIKEGKEPYKKVVNGICKGLGIAAGITLLLWFCNVRNITDVKRINTQCKVIEQDDKNVTMKCPLDMGEANKVESSKDESNQNKVDKTESNKDKITKEETNKSKEK